MKTDNLDKATSNNIINGVLGFNRCEMKFGYNLPHISILASR